MCVLEGLYEVLVNYGMILVLPKSAGTECYVIGAYSNLYSTKREFQGTQIYDINCQKLTIKCALKNAKKLDGL